MQTAIRELTAWLAKDRLGRRRLRNCEPRGREMVRQQAAGVAVVAWGEELWHARAVPRSGNRHHSDEGNEERSSRAQEHGLGLPHEFEDAHRHAPPRQPQTCGFQHQGQSAGSAELEERADGGFVEQQGRNEDRHREHACEEHARAHDEAELSQRPEERVQADVEAQGGHHQGQELEDRGLVHGQQPVCERQSGGLHLPVAPRRMQAE
mmetsp:Transcript_65393/g.202398  ORF Transcript_65393/g.202398 Transcript_65393/m.202398 type:complete len:208 (-) Transcript_65393:1077-1700(-)